MFGVMVGVCEIIICGVVLGVLIILVFIVVNVYLGLRVGLIFVIFYIGCGDFDGCVVVVC